MKKTLFLSCIIILFLGLLAGCHKPEKAANKDAKEELKTYKVSTQEVITYIEATGSVQPDLEGTSRILPFLAGSVSRIFVRAGDRVKKGDPLVSITSPEVTDTYAAYLSAVTQLKQAERIYNLNKELFEVGAVTKNDLLNSESNQKQLTAVVDGHKNKLSIYGFTISEDGPALRKAFNDTTTIRAPMNGYIADIQTHVGDRVDTATPLMTLADPKNIIIVANVYDTDIPKVKKGRKIAFTVDTFPGMVFSGVIAYVSDVSDMDSKTVKTFITMSERKDIFKQNMFLKLKIEDQKRLLPLIPQSAMIYKDGRFFVYYIAGKDKQTLKEIKPVKEVPGKFMAVEGVAEGAEIILTAIDLEKR
jgi:cobalt-zinc-cadmium efflux system membrane fusion protein